MAAASGKLPLSADQERALKPKDTFRECTNCPEMVVVPAGRFTMGSPTTEAGRSDDEGPQHTVTIPRQLAVGRFAVTFDEWDACLADGGCNRDKPDDQGWGRGRRPVIRVTWRNAQAYVDWLAKTTGSTYRLLSEAEYEYAARASTQTAWPWGNAIGHNNANCKGCGSQWDNRQTAPVGSFAANAFGLYDMVGNVWQWTEDCWHYRYDRYDRDNEAPADGSAWTTDYCDSSQHRVLRGGGWASDPRTLRAAFRGAQHPDASGLDSGFRVARTPLTP
jgi:formylglycine-generating enzyme required for sulfatase activity